MHLDSNPEVAKVAGQVRIEGGEGQAGEELMHAGTIKFEDGEGDRSHACAD